MWIQSELCQTAVFGHRRLYRVLWFALAVSGLLASELRAQTWGIESVASGAASGPPTRLFSDSWQNMGTLTLGGQNVHLDGLALHQNDGLFAFDLRENGSALVSIDVSTRECTQVGPVLLGREIRGAAFDGCALWALDTTADELLKVDHLSGEIVVPIYSLETPNIEFGNASDIAFGADGQLFLLSSRSVYRIDFLSPGNFTASLVFEDTEIDPTDLLEGCPGVPRTPGYAGMAIEAATGAFLMYDIICADDMFQFEADGTARTKIYSDVIPNHNAGRGDLASATTEICELTAVPGNTPELRQAPIGAPRPNPFNPVTEIEFSIPQESDVRLTVHDLAGRLVAVMVDARLTAGTHRAIWNGADALGGQVASGVYLFNLQNGGFSYVTRGALLK